MRRIVIAALCIMSVALLVGCDGDGDGGGGGGDSVSGTWSGTGSYHTGEFGEPLSMEFTMELNLNHQGTLVQGTYVVTRPVRGTMSGTASGTASAGTINMTLSPHGSASGQYGGGVMNLTWFEDWGGGRGLTGAVSLGHQ